MKKIRTNKNTLLAVLLVITVIIGATLLIVKKENDNANSSVPKGYVELKSYNHVEFGQMTCMAVIPECGICPGEVIDKKCYVKD
jgi:hypothetical protein